MKYLAILASVFKSICYLLLALALGYVVGDEIAQRKLRADLRSVCEQQFAERMGEPDSELAELVVKYQCRNAIP